MSTFDDFKKGERVAHIARGDGIVTAIEDGCVCVTYGETQPRGGPLVGKYDRRWFELHPGYLFHRRAG